MVVGAYGLVLLSDDGGQTFQPLATPHNGRFFTLEVRIGKADKVHGIDREVSQDR